MRRLSHASYFEIAMQAKSQQIDKLSYNTSLQATRCVTGQLKRSGSGKVQRFMNVNRLCPRAPELNRYTPEALSAHPSQQVAPR